MSRRVLRRSLCVLSALALAACADSGPAVAVFSIEVTAPSATLLVGPGGGQTVQMTATLRSASGDVLTGRRIEWSVDPWGFAFVDDNGLVTARLPGTAVVRARSEERTGTFAITVAPVPIATIDITSPGIALTRTPLAVAAQQVAAVAYDSVGTALPDRTLNWLSRDAAVASVNASGLVTAVGAGSTYVVASGDRGSDSVLVTVTVENGLPAGFDVAITDASWTQASQNAEGSIPMLTGGRAAVVNITTSAPSAMAAPSVIELRLTDADGTTRWSARRTVNIPSGATTTANPTVQVLVPAAQLAPGVQWEVRWNPDGEFSDADAATDRYPRIGRAGLAVVQPPTLKLRFVPVTLTAHNNTTGVVSAANAEEYLRVIRQIAPVGAIEFSIAPPFATSTSFGAPPNGAGSAFWIALLQQMDVERVASAEYADAHWVGVVQPPAGFTFATFGGFGFIPSNGASFGPGTRTFGVINTNWFFRESQTRELMMHELGHNLGRSHAPCGGATGTDVNFPDPGGRVGEGGHDTHSFQRGVAERAFSISSNHGDTMGYCTPVWISTYSYAAMLTFRGSATLAARQATPPTRAVVVHGAVQATGQVSLRHAVLLPATYADAPDAGDWVAIARDASGEVLAQRRFALGRLDHSDSERPIAVAIPLSDLSAARVAWIEVRAPSGTSTRLDVTRGAP